VADTPFSVQLGAETADQRLANIESTLRLLLLSGTNLPVTQIATALDGSRIGVVDKYIELYRNNFLRLIAVKVVADFSAAGQQVNLSLTTDLSNYGKIDTLVQGGKTTSDTIWLKPNQTLYVNKTAASGTLVGATLRVLMFDPLSFATYLNSGV
jgi:hypothetical protein